MIAPHWAGNNYGDFSYRVLTRAQPPQAPEMADCLSISAWSVGQVRIA